MTPFSKNDELPVSVLETIPDDALRTTFRSSLNTSLEGGATEMSAYIRAYKALEAAGAKVVDGKWVAKDSPTVGDVHTPKPINTKKPKAKDDPGTDPADVGEFEEIGAALRKHVTDETLEAITRPLAEGAGLKPADVRKIAAFWADPETPNLPDIARAAWGGYHANKWATRALKKAAAEAPASEAEEFKPPIEVNRAAKVAHAIATASAIEPEENRIEIVGTVV